MKIFKNIFVLHKIHTDGFSGGAPWRHRKARASPKVYKIIHK